MNARRLPRKRVYAISLFRVAAGVVLLSSCGLGLDPRLSLSQYIHTSWTKDEGHAIPGVLALAQTNDGYLWLGTTGGLLRFDGLRIVRFEPAAGEKLPNNSITSLALSARGGLWIGAYGGVSLLRQGHLTRFNTPDIQPDDPVFTMQEDGAGTLWAGSAKNKGLLAIAKGAARTYGVEQGLPGPRVLSLFRDRDEAIWVATSKGVCRWTHERAGPCPSLDGETQVRSMAGDAGGQLSFLGTMSGVLRLTGHGPEPLTDPKLAKITTNVLLRDRDGNLWVGTVGQGLFCVRDGRVEHFSRRDGLSSDVIAALLEDREGNIWAGTPNGFDRLRDPKVARWSTIEGLPGNLITAVSSTRNGDVWVAAANAGLTRLGANGVTTYSADSGLPGNTVLALYEDAKRVLWAGTLLGLAYRSGERFIEVRGAGGSHLANVYAITGTPDGTLWLADLKGGLLKFRDGQLTPYPLEPSKTIYQLGSQRNGDIWIGYLQGGAAVLGNGPLRTYPSGSGLAAGRVQAIYEDDLGSVWFGTSEGLSRLRNGQWTTWTAGNGLPQGGVQAITGDARGNLWLATPQGAAPLPLSDLQNPDGSPKYLTLSVIGPDDGIRLPRTGKMANPRVARTRDGRLWWSTEDGVATLDPARIRTNTVPPPLAIEQLTVDGRPLSLTGGEIPLRGREVQIEYTALSLTLPETVRFRYRLEGFDANWIDAGTRRQIVYANLPPGHYRFQVIACNNDGIWNKTGAGLAFRFMPYFYQTWWFYVLCSGTLALAVYGVHLLRVQQIRFRFQLVLQERARLTRELHDTILQGFAGVVYQLEAASRQLLSRPDAAKRRIARALEQADQSLQEARQALSCMRLSALENHTLPEALMAAARQIVDGTPIHFDMEVKGRVRQLPYDVQANLYIIAREAMNNAMNHAQPERLSLELVYAGDRVQLTVQDDGIGFDPGSASNNGKHWGLAGMRERARHISGCLTLDSRPGRGTKLEVVVEQKQPRDVNA